jgi:hypothetical protein
MGFTEYWVGVFLPENIIGKLINCNRYNFTINPINVKAEMLQIVINGVMIDIKSIEVHSCVN